MSDTSAAQQASPGATSARIRAAQERRATEAEVLRLAAKALRAENKGSTEIGRILGISPRHAARLAPPATAPRPAPESAPTAATSALDTATPADTGQPRAETGRPADVPSRPAPTPGTRGRNGRFRGHDGGGRILPFIFLDEDFVSVDGEVSSAHLGPSYPVHSGQVLVARTIADLGLKKAVLDREREDMERADLEQARAESYAGVMYVERPR